MQRASRTILPEPHRIGWLHEVKRNSPQASSLGSASYILISGGMGFIETVLPACVMPFKYISNYEMLHFKISWFIAVVVGSYIVTILIDKMSKRSINILASYFVIVKGIVLIAAPENFKIYCITRYVDGFSVGLTIIPTIVLGSEQAVKQFRAYILTNEQYHQTLGMLAYVIINSYRGFNLSITNRVYGILVVAFGLIALACAYKQTIESPISYLKEGNEEKALKTLCALQSSTVVTNETQILFNENKQLIAEDIARGHAKNISIGLIPMVKLCLFRAFIAMSISIGMTCAYIWTIHLAYFGPMFLFFLLFRLTGIAFSMYTLDIVGRKFVGPFSCLFCGILLLSLGNVFSNSDNFFKRAVLNSAFLKFFAYQFFAGLAAPASTCYLGEAFSISVKPYFILVVIAFESIVHVIICCTFGVYGTTQTVMIYAYVVGILHVIFGIFFLICMPETKETTLREALAKFEKVVDLDCPLEI